MCLIFILISIIVTVHCWRSQWNCHRRRIWWNGSPFNKERAKGRRKKRKKSSQFVWFRTNDAHSLQWGELWYIFPVNSADNFGIKTLVGGDGAASTASAYKVRKRKFCVCLFIYLFVARPVMCPPFRLALINGRAYVGNVCLCAVPVGTVHEPIDSSIFLIEAFLSSSSPLFPIDSLPRTAVSRRTVWAVIR